MTKRWFALGLSVLLVVLVGGSTPAQAAVPVSAVGWWTRSPSPAAPPDGGIAVGEAPDGNLSVAAIRISTGGGASGAKLTLAESGGQGQEAASLQVCTTADGWNSAAGDDIGLAPRPDCPTEPVLLARDAAGSWTADLSTLVAGKTGEVSLMIVPGPPPAAVPGVAAAGAFQVAFNPPTVDGTVAPEASDSSSGSSYSFSDTPSSGSSTFPSAAPYSAPDYSVANSPAFAPVGNTPSAVLPATQAPAVVSSQDAGGGQTTFPVNDVGASKKPTSRLVLVGFVLLSVLVGGAAAAVRMLQEKGAFNRLIPSGGGSFLPPE
jgi:hypothetical protein